MIEIDQFFVRWSGPGYYVREWSVGSRMEIVKHKSMPLREKRDTLTFGGEALPVLRLEGRFVPLKDLQGHQP